jgi:hypothetical protein
MSTQFLSGTHKNEIKMHDPYKTESIFIFESNNNIDDRMCHTVYELQKASSILKDSYFSHESKYSAPH